MSLFVVLRQSRGAQAGLQLTMKPRLLPSKHQDSRHVLAHMVCAVIRMEPMASWIINTRSISSWAMSAAPTVHFYWPSPDTLPVSLCPFPSCPLPYSVALFFLSRHRLSKALFPPTCFPSWSLSQDFPIPSRGPFYSCTMPCAHICTHTQIFILMYLSEIFCLS